MKCYKTAGFYFIAAASLLLAGCASFNSGETAGNVHTAPFAAPLDRQILITVAQTPMPYTGAPHARLLSGWQHYGPAPQTAQTLAAITREYDLIRGEGWAITALDVYCAVLVVPAGRSVNDLLATLSADERVAGVQRMHRFEAQADSPSTPLRLPSKALPNDPYYKMQTALQLMDFAAAHVAAKGAGVQVAVIDTGVDSTHPELAGQIALSRNFVGAENTAPKNAQLAEQHGTAIAGLVAALADNGIGIAGAAPSVEILALRACWQTDTSGAAACNSFTLAKALGFAVDQKVDVINLSISGPADPLLEQLTTVAAQRGIIVIGAAPAKNTRPGFPANAIGVIAVTNTQAANHTKTLVAPGKDVLTLAPHNEYVFISGDSLATALVTGVAALLLEAQPDLSSARLAQVLHTAMQSTPDGTLLLNACRALNTVRATACPLSPPLTASQPEKASP